MSSTSGRDKRQFERVQIDSKNFSDISEGGVFIKTTTPRGVGSVLHLEIKMEGLDEPIKAIAKVVRVIYEAGSTRYNPPGMAMQFTEITPEARLLIRSLMEKLRHESKPQKHK